MKVENSLENETRVKR